MSVQFAEDLATELNDKCLYKNSQDFCWWSVDDIQIDNQRKYCRRVWHGCCHFRDPLHDSYTELCENCEKLLSKSAILQLNLMIRELENKVNSLQKQIDDQKLSDKEHTS